MTIIEMARLEAERRLLSVIKDVNNLSEEMKSHFSSKDIVVRLADIAEFMEVANSSIRMENNDEV